MKAWSSDVSFSDTSFDDNILDNIDYVYGDNSYSLLYQAGSSTETSFSNVTWQGNEIWSNDDNWAWFYFSSPNGSRKRHVSPTTPRRGPFKDL